MTIDEAACRSPRRRSTPSTLPGRLVPRSSSCWRSTPTIFANRKQRRESPTSSRPSSSSGENVCTSSSGPTTTTSAPEPPSGGIPRTPSDSARRQATTTDIVLPDGRAAWCDGGPRGPVDVREAIVHRETIERGDLHTSPARLDPARRHSRTRRRPGRGGTSPGAGRPGSSLQPDPARRGPSPLVSRICSETGGSSRPS